ncbi:MAG: LLM class F420-dependent oxidoreductase, partial [Anaerolineales bacterium]|nr:LLM class F420-dependent oxidoreductase [Anaerolineales bacterium]
LLAYDHVLGADPTRPGGWSGPYTDQHPFHEVFVLFSYLAGLTRRLEFCTGVLILPQRQTALVAKQAASLDVLSGGRLRLGVGLGWNAVEYAALGEDFHNRGRRIEEQITLLRRLWTEPRLDYQGRWHAIPAAGLNPLPVQRPIPIWMGGYHDNVLRRAAQLADGWLPGARRAAEAQPALDALARYLDEAGRPRASFGLEPRLAYDPPAWEAQLREWEAAGATHASLITTGQGFTTPAQHVQALQTFARAAGLTPSA